MTNDEEKYFEDYFDTFATPGWKQFMDEMQEIQDELNNLLNVTSADDFLSKKGQAQILNRILNFQSAIERVYKDQKGLGL